MSPSGTVALLYRALSIHPSLCSATQPMPDFWTHSGFHLTTRDSSGQCVPGGDLFRAYFARPEIAPVADSCIAERRLFDRLQSDPFAAVATADLAALADADARDNYKVVLAFRDHLQAMRTLEQAYRDFFVSPSGQHRNFLMSGFPPLFADQLAQMILRSMLDTCEDGLMARAAELFFREQRVHLADGQALLADLETIEIQAQVARDGSGYGNLGRLIADARTPLRSLELDVLEKENANTYWGRDERHDTALRVNFGCPGLAALCLVIERWIAHFHGIEVHVEPIRLIEVARMRWYVGLDSAATALLNEIYNQEPLADASRQRILCMMSLRFADESLVLASARGIPCFMALAMDENNNVRMKPQNLLTNLPLRRVA